jgi:two-component system sensor histidine kinase FlrB
MKADWITKASVHSSHQKPSEWADEIYQSLPMAVIVLSEQGQVIEANHAAVELLEHSLVGQLWYQLMPVLFAEGQEIGHDLKLKSGKIVSVQTQALKGQKGQVILLTDQTARKTLEAKVAHLEKLSLIGQMFAKLAHQIRTPISTASIYLENLLLQMEDGSGPHKMVDKVIHKLTDLNHIVANLLNFSKEGLIIDQEITLDVLLSDIKCLCLEHGMRCSIDVSKLMSLTQLQLKVNYQALLNALENVLINAKDACVNANVAPQIQLQANALNDQVLLISMVDNGPGLTLSQKDCLEPFKSTKAEGTGLGLPVVKMIMEAHGGHFSIHNTADQTKGAEARIILPIQKDMPITCEEETDHDPEQKDLCCTG